MLLLVVELFYPQAWLLTVLACFAALVHGARLWGWYSRLIWSVPLLWVLHLGYAWLVLGLVFKAALITEAVAPVLATHALAAAIAVLCLGMMSRVALGHTGRMLMPAASMGWAFAFINLAMVARVLLPMIVPAWIIPATIASAGLWLLAFALFVHVYWPVLSRARVDGQPG
ncbi:MAG TPA: NnrS family protein [Candidatus Tenderia electrophaga]|uniref:NnrS family protein n=1 Tax=Candidatus Tenderia electrophaga TaxID=1748243 RepID=A0A832N5R1_9GAMM|nr:NnrS family protein [Candidatus Tenderia electrophaga]